MPGDAAVAQKGEIGGAIAKKAVLKTSINTEEGYSGVARFVQVASDNCTGYRLLLLWNQHL